MVIVSTTNNSWKIVFVLTDRLTGRLVSIVVSIVMLHCCESRSYLISLDLEFRMDHHKSCDQ